MTRLRIPRWSALIAAPLLFVASMAAAQQNQAHLHMGHVLTAWNDAPDGRGLLPTARAEAEVVLQHAGFAAQKLDDLNWMKTHAGHILHAADPRSMGDGPGLGYGIFMAAKCVAAHIGFASEFEGATDNVKAHAVHVSASANNVVMWSQEIVKLAKGVRGAYSAGDAAPVVEQIQALALQILNGVDADGDGTISWADGEGGIAQAEQHMGFMRQGEGV